MPRYAARKSIKRDFNWILSEVKSETDKSNSTLFTKYGYREDTNFTNFMQIR